MKYSPFFRGLFCLLFSLALPSAYGQTFGTHVKPRVMLGVTGGANLSHVIFTPNVSQKTKGGYDLGAIFRIDVESYAGIWLEMDYSVRGWREDPPEGHRDYTYERTMRYVSVPFMTHLMIGSGAFKLTVDAGPQFGYFLSESAVSTFPDQALPGVVTKQHVMPTEKKFAWGLGGGPGFEYHVGHFVLGLRGAYYYGLGDFYNNTRKDYFGKASEQIYSVKGYLFYVF